MTTAVFGWAFPAVVVAATVGLLSIFDMPPRLSRGMVAGSGLAALQVYVTTAALRLSWDRPWFWPVWLAGIFARLIFVATTAYVVFRHTQLDFVATMASLVCFTTLFLVVESAACPKKG